MADLLFHPADDVVHAVLAFIDNFEGDADVELPQPSPTPPLAPVALPPSPTTSEIARRPRMHSGQRVRNEIQRLRASAVEMETRVQQLRQRRAGDANAKAIGSPTAMSSSRAEAARSWEDIAQRQRAQCDHARRENARLKALLVQQARIARKLETVVARTRRVESTKRVKRELLLAERALGCDHLSVRTVSCE